MAVLSKDELKALFQTKDRPTGDDFAALIDAMLHADFSNWPDILPAASAKDLTEIQAQTTVNAWADVDAAPGYVAADELSLFGNLESAFVVGRRVRLTLDSGFAYSEVLSATYSSGSNSTALVLADSVADSTISDIDISIFLPVSEGGAVGLGTLGGTAYAETLLAAANASAARVVLGVLAASQTVAGIIEVATPNEVQTATDGLRAVPPTGFRSFFRGCVIPYANGGGVPPWGLECNGQNVSRATYADLFAIIGTQWGAGDGSTTFTLPDFRRRAIVGKGGTGTGVLANSVGSVGGVETVNLQHGHSVSGSTDIGDNLTLNVTASGGSSASSETHNHQVTGTAANNLSTAQSIMQPSAVVAFMIVF